MKNEPFITCALVLLVASSFSIVELAHASEPQLPFRRYAGYILYYYTTYADEGVLGEICTIDPYVPKLIGSELLAEWVTIVLQYSPVKYWLQVGYYKGIKTNYSLGYYYEYSDSHGSTGFKVGRWGATQPSPGSWHTYFIVHPYGYGESYDPYEWRFYIDGFPPGKDLIRVDPYVAVDQQASVETVSQFPAIKIDGSHFRRLSYFTLVKYWRWALWDTHQRCLGDPYTLTEVSNSEFTASGGG